MDEGSGEGGESGAIGGADDGHGICGRAGYAGSIADVGVPCSDASVERGEDKSCRFLGGEEEVGRAAVRDNP
ncbi:MAG: hypothetical protein QOE55_364, partial [Acidobacteriaceae bacterium]|nr:hypothetical protein [Acidobacteriaceae bacterium]